MIRQNLSTAFLLFWLFLALKLAAVTSWSWWFVFAPLWGPPGVILVAAGLIGITWKFGGKKLVVWWAAKKVAKASLKVKAVNTFLDQFGI
jgi:hypothetical protein